MLIGFLIKFVYADEVSGSGVSSLSESTHLANRRPNSGTLGRPTGLEYCSHWQAARRVGRAGGLPREPPCFLQSFQDSSTGRRGKPLWSSMVNVKPRSHTKKKAGAWSPGGRAVSTRTLPLFISPDLMFSPALTQ